MKFSTFLMILVSLTFYQIGFSQSEHQVRISQDEAKVALDKEIESYSVEIAGPNQYYNQQTVQATGELTLSNIKADGKKFADGQYTLQLTPIYELTPLQRKEISKLKAQNDFEGINAYRLAENLPTYASGIVTSFRISGGKFVPNLASESPLSAYSTTRSLGSPFNQSLASMDEALTYTSVDYTSSPLRSTSSFGTLVDQVFVDDLIVQGSSCVGIDCTNGESFGFDTQRLKENNLRLHFDDTSASASFPANDWRLAANDSANGGASFFSIEDATAGTVPFRVAAGAGNNALWVSNSGGNVGMGTATPVVELHVTDGDSPTMRLEQSGANGWTPQTWDIAGNETNFFVRDVTNGSKLPFKIRPGAPDNSVYINTDGNVGIGTASPTAGLYVKADGLTVEAGDVTISSGDLNLTGNQATLGDFRVRGAISRTIVSNSVVFRSETQGAMMEMDAATGFVGIGTSPSHQLELSADDAVKPNGGSWSGPSDRRLKENIRPFTDGLNVVSQINPVVYNYNGKLDLPTEPDFIGVVAQEVQPVAGYMVKPLNKTSDYLSFDPSSINFVLINAVQEQQQMINDQKSEIQNLKAQLEMLGEMNAKLATLASKVDALSADKVAKKSSVSED